MRKKPKDPLTETELEKIATAATFIHFKHQIPENDALKAVMSLYTEFRRTSPRDLAVSLASRLSPTMVEHKKTPQELVKMTESTAVKVALFVAYDGGEEMLKAYAKDGRLHDLLRLAQVKGLP